MRTPPLPCLLFPLLLAAPSAAQVPLVLEGDVISGVGAVTSIQNITVDSSGRWLVEVDTDNPDTDADGALLRDGSLYRFEGGPVPAPAGATIDSFDAVRNNDAGEAIYNLILDGTAGGTADDDALYLDDALVLQQGDPVMAAGVGPGTLHGAFQDAQLTGNRLVLLRGFFDDSNVPGTTDYYCLVLALDASGNVLSETRIAGEGDVPPGQSLVVNTIRSGPHSASINSAGDVIWCADLDTASLPDDAVVYLNSTLLAQEGMPTGFGANWGNLISPEVDLNDAGDWTLKDTLEGGDGIIVKNGQSFRREGDTLPAIAPFVLEYFGNGPAALSESGGVLWFGRWSEPDSNRDEGLFFDDTLLVQEGVTQIAGMTVVDVGDQSENYLLSADGDWVIFEATVDDGGGLREGAFLLELGLGTNYCTSTVNSTGQRAVMSAQGSSSVAANDLVLIASPVPVQPGIFFYGPSQVLVPFGNGFRCVGGTVFRLPVEAASGSGVLDHALDNTMPPGASGQITAGSTWNFQAWFRDPSAGGAFFNLSDGLELSFTP